ncbi:mitoguardin [Bicyclus anynana]|uniref:Mitoguardin n=1 Tax=Bicyclus anynana TaxID=110368 RepID=A0A6J1N8Z9_BICAN|nr:mitoguardin [Bicyclus anynana]XP_052747020.1 mitoguardin [Bicyclus anynana]
MMQHMIQASPVLEKLKHFQQVLSYRIQLTTSQKVVLWSLGVVGTSAVVVGVLSRYLARRRAKPIFNPRIQRAINKRLSRMRSPNGGMGSVASSGGRSSPLGFSERLSLASGSIGSGGGDAAPLSPQQLGVMGMEALETSINYWEDALAAFSVGARGGVTGTLALTSPEEAEFCREIQDLLQNAYLLQERCELLFLDQRSVLFRSESGGAGAGEGSAGRRTRLLSSHTASEHTRKEHHSSAESFASAEDQVADLREFDDLAESVAELENLELYQMAVKQFDVGIPYRTLRTEVVQCGSDTEFLCKLHCLRLGFQHVLRAAAARAWFVDAGRQVLTDLLLFADKEPKEFLVAYEEMVSWTNDPANWSAIENELTSKGVKVVSFYDVVLDYILLDAFEDLAAPPASVLAVVRNRWLSDGFKESALTTAVWSVIKAKRRYLQYPDGFMAHFYSISEHLLPVLVWGFLGPRERLRDVCESFQSEIVGFVTDLFSFHKCRYTTVDELAIDIMEHARSRATNITDKIAERV